MYHESRSSRIPRRVVIAALLLHLALIVLIARMHFDTTADHALKKLMETIPFTPKEQQSPFVAHKAAAAPVIFKDTSHQEPEQNLQKNTVPEETKEATPVTENRFVSPDAINLMKKQIEKHVSLSKQESKPTEDQNQKPKEETVAGSKKGKKEGTSKKAPAKSLSFAQLAKGFMTHLNKGGGDARAEILGPEGKVTAEQLKHERFIQKLNACFDKSISIHRDKQPDLYDKHSLQVAFVLNRNGSLGHLKLVESSGKPAFDNYMLFIIQDASTSFPPLPRFIPGDKYLFHYIMSMEPHGGFGWQFAHS